MLFMVYPLFRALSHDANAPVVVPGRLSLLQRLPSTLHFQIAPCTGHHTPRHPWHHISTHSLGIWPTHHQTLYASVVKKSKRDRTPSSDPSKRSQRSTSAYGPNRNTDFPYGQPFSRYPHRSDSNAKPTGEDFQPQLSLQPFGQIQSVRGPMEF